MVIELSTFDTPPPDIKRVPAERTVREAIRRLAGAHAAKLDQQHPPTRDALEALARTLLAELGLPLAYLGFAMVAVNNAFWRAQYASVPYAHRLLLLPHCLRDHAACLGEIDAAGGLHCARCGACSIDRVQAQAERLGYRIIVAEGTSSVLMKILDGEADALLGVACLDSLDKSFARAVDLGIPQIAIPLLADGCTNTQAELDEILSYLHLHGEPLAVPTRSYIPLLRESVRLCSEPALTEILQPHVAVEDGPLHEVDRTALAWLGTGGKRFRPFITLAAYAVARHGTAALQQSAELSALLPTAVRRVALAIEVLHKASLIHDDIEDNDAFRYGHPTLHRAQGVGPAINAGDYLVGLGYRLIAGEAATLGAACVADILNRLSAAHLDLCRGQGAELHWTHNAIDAIRPLDVLAIYALKTAPAFEMALYAGLRTAEIPIDIPALQRFATYLGEGYQVLNDLDDWADEDQTKVTLGQDALAARPTILRAFTLQAGGGDALQRLTASDPPDLLQRTRAIYTEYGAFAQAKDLLEKLRARAAALAKDAPTPAIRELLEFLLRVVLRRAAVAREPGMP